MFDKPYVTDLTDYDGPVNGGLGWSSPVWVHVES